MLGDPALLRPEGGSILEGEGKPTTSIYCLVLIIFWDVHQRENHSICAKWSNYHQCLYVTLETVYRWKKNEPTFLDILFP